MPLHRTVALTTVAGLVAGAMLGGVRRVEVWGDSMAPALLPGDHLLVLRRTRPRPGDVVALRDPRDPGRAVVKRVAAVPGGAATCGGEVLRAGSGYVVLGDNLTASTDSRSFGPVPRRLLLGRCVYRYAPEHRRGGLSRRG
jgi:nickel-type superoxide dismutase maturation protease